MGSLGVKAVRFSGSSVGAEFCPFVNAKTSGNRNGDLGRALAVVDAMADSGAMMIELRTGRAGTIHTGCYGPAFHVREWHALWGGCRLYQLYEDANIPWDWREPLFAQACQHGLVSFSSPFDETAVDHLESLEIPAHKISTLLCACLVDGE